MNVLEQIMGVHEAALRWRMSREDVVRLCEEGRVQAVRLAGEETWVLAKDQLNPVTGESPVRRETKPGLDKAAYMSSKLMDALYE